MAVPECSKLMTSTNCVRSLAFSYCRKRKKEEKMLGNCIFVGIGGMAGAVILAGSWMR